MSLPPDQRGRKRRQGPVGGTPPAQMGHANNPRARRQARDGQRRLEAERLLREDAARYREGFPELDTEAALERIMGRIREAGSST
jgi:hypothetical protein